MHEAEEVEPNALKGPFKPHRGAEELSPNEKRYFDSIDDSLMGGLKKRHFDSIDDSFLGGLKRNSFDSIDDSFLGGLRKRRFDSIDDSFLGGFKKRNWFAWAMKILSLDAYI